MPFSTGLEDAWKGPYLIVVRLLWYLAKVLYIVGALQGGWVACGLFLIHFCGK